MAAARRKASHGFAPSGAEPGTLVQTTARMARGTPHHFLLSRQCVDRAALRAISWGTPTTPPERMSLSKAWTEVSKPARYCAASIGYSRSEEHTSELQSRGQL